MTGRCRGNSVSLVGLLATGLASAACASAGAVAGPAAFPRAPVPALRGPEHAGSPSMPLVEAVIESSLSLVGTPYRVGGEDPSSGFDCSGLIRYALAAHGIDAPRTVAEQYASGRPVSPDRLQAGDLVFFSTIGPGATHVGIVLETAGAGTFVHAPGAGGVVRVERFDTGYWRSRFIGARRLF